jgi:hypothetical protein
MPAGGSVCRFTQTQQQRTLQYPPTNKAMHNTHILQATQSGIIRSRSRIYNSRTQPVHDDDEDNGDDDGKMTVTMMTIATSTRT